MILGQRADTLVLRDKTKKCIIEGEFSLQDYNLGDFFNTNELDFESPAFIRREISPNGKSRAFVNDTPVTLTVLSELGDLLVSIHSQHSILTLNNAGFQLAVLDDYAGISGEAECFRELYHTWQQLKKRYLDLEEKDSKAKSEFDYFNFLFEELETAKITEGEQIIAEEKLKILSHSEEIKSNLFKALNSLSGEEGGALNQLSSVIQAVNQVSTLYPGIDGLVDRLRSNLIDLKDIYSEIDQISGKIFFDPEESEVLTSRLDLLYKLEKKHQANSDQELITIRGELSDKLLSVTNISDQLAELEKEITDHKKVLLSKADELSTKRIAAIGQFEDQIIANLRQMGMPDAKFIIRNTLLEIPGQDGKDQLKFLFSANKGVDPDDVSKIASGGELSRLMLSIKSLVSQKKLLPTIIFDEIDIGISGEIAGKMGNVLKGMANKMQVIAITHLPQIAGAGKHHFKVFKENEGERTRTRVTELSKEERIEEIAKMLSSGEVTASASRVATELLK